MWGSFSLGSFVAVGAIVALVVALAFLASPLIAVGFALLAAAPMVGIAVGMREGSEGAVDRRRGRPTTPEGRPVGPTGSRSGGEPASGEG